MTKCRYCGCPLFEPLPKKSRSDGTEDERKVRDICDDCSPMLSRLPPDVADWILKVSEHVIEKMLEEHLSKYAHGRREEY